MTVVYKCKECGGDVQLLENGLGKCLYCGALQTLPKEKDDKISNLLNQANDYRLHCDFDRAIFTYEQVLDLKESEPEAHWGLFLSKYGVEYVKDSMTLTYKPTLHRISAVSVFDDADYQATIKYASPFSVTKYNQDASDIEAVMKELLVISANQEPYDVFLSYKEADDTTGQRTNDSYLAHDLYNELTGKGYKVFFAPKSLGVGLYEPKIYSAIISAKVMIVLGTKPEYFDAVWVKNEWSRFAELIDNGEQKVIVPVYKDMKAEQLPNRLAKFQAYDMASISFLPTLLSIISKLKKQKSRVKISRDTKTEDVYLERGFIELGDKHFTQAKTFFENVLNINPHNAQAYFGELMVEMHITKPEQVLTSQKYLSEYTTFKNAVKFADQQLKTTLLQYEQGVYNNLCEQEYQNAMKLKDSGLYKGAVTVFQKIQKYKDSKEQIEFCRNAINDEVYQSGISYIDAGLFEKAVIEFQQISQYKDAKSKLDYSLDKLKEKCQNVSEYKKLIELLRGLSEIDPQKYNFLIENYSNTVAKLEKRITGINTLIAEKEEKLRQIKKCQDKFPHDSLSSILAILTTVLLYFFTIGYVGPSEILPDLFGSSFLGSSLTLIIIFILPVPIGIVSYYLYKKFMPYPKEGESRKLKVEVELLKDELSKIED